MTPLGVDDEVESAEGLGDFLEDLGDFVVVGDVVSEREDFSGVFVGGVLAGGRFGGRGRRLCNLIRQVAWRFLDRCRRRLRR